MWFNLLVIATMGAVAAFCLILLVRNLRRSLRDASFARARKEFRLQREHLEAKFFSLASSSGKPRGLEWTGCDFENDVTYARDRESGDLAAFVGITIRFAAIAGGGMEDVEAVSNLRAATAVFQYTNRQWRTDGRAIFNLNPTETIRHYSSLELLAQDVTAHA